MVNKPTPITVPLPWTKEQFNEMKRVLNEVIPAQEDNLRRTKASGIDTSILDQQLSLHKKALTDMVNAWKDKYD